MTDLRLVAFAALAGVSGVFLVGVRRVFRRPPGRHRYRASLVTGLVLVAEGAAILARPVPPARMLAAGAVFLVALGLFGWAARVNRERPLLLAFAAPSPDYLQTRGPYALVRHPFYASYILGFAGGLLAAGTPWLLPAVAVGIANYWRAAAREERDFQASPLAGAHRVYAERVGMFVPRLASLRVRGG
jgi:protein-S-isoprenylcysteine O-methyltransferase Ste14